MTVGVAAGPAGSGPALSLDRLFDPRRVAGVGGRGDRLVELNPVIVSGSGAVAGDAVIRGSGRPVGPTVA